MDDGVDGGGFEWRCEHCGERTPRHNPPCSNCGGMQFEKVPVNTEADVEAAESLVPTTRRALLAYGAAGVAAVVGGGYLLYDEYTPPAIPDAPGRPESAGGISFAAVESGVVDRVNDERETDLSPTESARNAARYATAYTVVEGDDGDARELFGRLNEFHVGEFRYVRRVYGTQAGSEDRAIDGFASADELAGALADDWLGSDEVREVLVADRFSNVGVDVHVDPAGDVYAALVVATGGDGFL